MGWCKRRANSFNLSVVPNIMHISGTNRKRVDWQMD